MLFHRAIDPHVHLRGMEYTEPFATWAIDDAVAVGLAALGEMPNRKPSCTSLSAAMARFTSLSLPLDLTYFAHVALTADAEQVLTFLREVSNRAAAPVHPVVSDKIFYTGPGGDQDYWRWIWQKKAQYGYTGVSLGHFEDPFLFLSEDLKGLLLEVFQSAPPVFHSLERPLHSELLSVEQQLRNAVDVGFAGTFYVCHVSNPATVDFLLTQRRRYSRVFSIIMEVTFHHLFLNTTDYTPLGSCMKMNPPLRSPIVQERLLQHCCDGHIDVIGSDHAPHPILLKQKSDSAPSGIPALPFWPKGMELLLKAGAPLSLLQQMTFHTPKKLFRLITPFRPMDLTYNPALWDKYGYNPFVRVDH